MPCKRQRAKPRYPTWRQSLAATLAPLPDLENKAATKLHLANVLTRRALGALAA